MASGQWAVVLRHVQKLFHGGSVAGLTEGQLLDRFLATRDETAFGAIVARHGPMVLGVCRGVLNDPHDVEDAFQATFLILVKKAGGLRNRDRLGPWLYGVARRVSLKSRDEASRRRSKESLQDPGAAETTTTLDAELRELQWLIREEVDRLSCHDRMAVVLCYLEGLTHEEAADRLGWPIGTVKGRLSRAREKLRDRLSRRGVSLPGVFAANFGRTLPNLIPSALARSTTQAAIRLAAGQTLTAGIVSAQVLTLMEGVIGTMFTTQLKIAATVVVASCVLAVPGVLAYPGLVVQEKKEQVSKPVAGPVQRPGATPTISNPASSVAAETGGASPQLKTGGPTPDEARGVSAEVAEQAIKLMDDLRKAGDPVSENSYALWSNRLLELKLTPGILPANRLTLLRDHRKRMEEIYLRVKQLKNNGKATELDVFEASFQMNEAYRQVLQAEAGPRSPVTPPPVGLSGGGGFGGAEGDGSNHMVPLNLKQSPEDEKKNEIILKKLEIPIAMKFATDTPLEDLKKYVQETTQDEVVELPNGIPIYVDPDGLKDAEKTMASTISIDLEGIPLRTTLRLALRQIKLDYRVTGGLLIISHEDDISAQNKLAERGMPGSPRPFTKKGGLGP